MNVSVFECDLNMWSKQQQQHTWDISFDGCLFNFIAPRENNEKFKEVALLPWFIRWVCSQKGDNCTQSKWSIEREGEREGKRQLHV